MQLGATDSMSRVCALVLLVAAATVALACSSTAPAQEGAGKENSSTGEGSCSVDADCASNFCDRSKCATPGSRNYGAACIVPEADPTTGVPNPSDYTCGAYLCLSGKCRSCVTDSECQKTLGSPTCAPGNEWSGKACGRY